MHSWLLENRSVWEPVQEQEMAASENSLARHSCLPEDLRYYSPWDWAKGFA